MELYEIFQICQEFDYVLVEATVATGMETSAASEVKEKIPWVLDICKSRGRVFFCTISKYLPETLLLRSVDRIYIVISMRQHIMWPTDKDESLLILDNLLLSANWNRGVSLWKIMSGFRGKCFPSKEQHQEAYLEEEALKKKLEETSTEEEEEPGFSQEIENDSSLPQRVREYKEKRIALKQSILSKIRRQTMYQNMDKRLEEDKVIKFRMTCYRSGTHCFTSPDVASYLGGRLQGKYNWVVNLVNHDLETIVNIKENEAYLTISLTKDSLHKRNIVHFGPTTLRATVCYNLLHMATPRVGDIVLDPLCGGASIPVEGALAFSALYHIAGDKHEKAVLRAFENIQSMPSKRKGYVDLVHWDVTNLPLRDSCIDVMVTDLPFGKRSGSKINNQVLYRKAMMEAARCVSPSGRAVCLTWDRTNLTRTLRVYSVLWTMARIVNINLGGLQATVYVVKRTLESLKTFLLAAPRDRRKKKFRKDVKK